MLARLAATAVWFCALEGLAFHTPLYPLVTDPDSTTGAVETKLRDEMRRQKSGPNQVLAVGHSRMGLIPRIANTVQPETGYMFANIWVGGTTPRCWYYELRAVDPTARAYAAILIPSDDYDELDEYDDWRNHIQDLHYLAGRLGWSDAWQFASSYPLRATQWEAFRGIFLRGHVYQQDFLEFLAHPVVRISRARENYLHSADWEYGFRGSEESLAGLQIDWKHQTARFPAGLTPDQQQSFAGYWFRPHLNNGRQTAYLRLWYGRILERYRGTGTRLIFLRLPRVPNPPPDGAPKVDSAVRQAARQPGVIVLEEHTFDSLERPELFADALHMNAEGLQRFSEMVAREVRKVLGPPRR